MRNFIVTTLLALGLALPASGQTESAKDLVMRLAQDNAIFMSWYGLGSFDVKRDNALERYSNDLESGIITEAEYNELRCLANSGYVRFISDIDTMKNATMPVFGIVRHIIVAATPDGDTASNKYKRLPAAALGLSRHPKVPLIFILQAEARVGSVLDDHTVQKDVNQYRVIKATLELTATAEQEREIARCGVSRRSTFNLVALFKKDSFSGKWITVTWDGAYPPTETGNNVANALAKAN